MRPRQRHPRRPGHPRFHRRTAPALVLAAAVLGAAPAMAHASSDFRATAKADVLPSVDHVSTAPDPVTAGEVVELRTIVRNRGQGKIPSRFGVNIHLPQGATFGPKADKTHLAFPKNCTPGATAADISCTFAKGLPGGTTAVVLLPVQIAEDAPAGGVLTGGLVTVDCVEDRAADRAHKRAADTAGYPFDIRVGC